MNLKKMLKRMTGVYVFGPEKKILLMNNKEPRANFIKGIKTFLGFLTSEKRHTLGEMSDGRILSLDYMNLLRDGIEISPYKCSVFELAEILDMINQNMEKILQDDFDYHIRKEKQYSEMEQNIQNLQKIPLEIQKNLKENINKPKKTAVLFPEGFWDIKYKGEDILRKGIFSENRKTSARNTEKNEESVAKAGPITFPKDF